MKVQNFILSFFLVLCGSANAETTRDTDAATNRPAIYQEDDSFRHIADALVTAKKEQKRVLILFGANYCVPCLLLHKAVESDAGISSFMKSHYVIAMLDVSYHSTNGGPCFEQYNTGIRVIPMLVVLDLDGKRLITQNAAAFNESGRYNPQRILTFLQKWALYPKNAISPAGKQVE